MYSDFILNKLIPVIFQSQDGSSQSQPLSRSPVPTKAGKALTEISDTPTVTAEKPKLISLENIMKSQASNGSLLKGAQSLMSTLPSTSVAAEAGKSAGEKVHGIGATDVIVLSDSSAESPTKMNPESKTGENFGVSPLSQNQNEATASALRPQDNSPAQQVSNAPTVKIKMGLLQAVKRFKPNVKDDKAQASADNETSVEETMSSALSEDESEAPLPSATDDAVEGSSESSSESSSSSSKGSDDSSSSDDEENENSDSSDDAGDDDDNGSESEQPEKEANKPAVPVKLKMKVVTTTEDEEESSDNADEIDLVSSEEEQDDEKDKDYNASEDEGEDDVIMISDDEYRPKGRAVIPSPVRESVDQEMEILVNEVPSFDPIISSIMSDAVESANENKY